MIEACAGSLTATVLSTLEESPGVLGRQSGWATVQLML